VKGIITDSATGQTARNLAAFRGPTPVLAICYNEKLQRWLNLSYGITPVYQKEQISQQELFVASVRMLRQKGYILDEDKVAYLSGSLGEGGGTSFLEINKVNDIMKRTTKYQGTDK
jgi:pyruvate kinase